MIRNILLVFSVLILGLSIASCEEEKEYKRPNPNKRPGCDYSLCGSTLT